MARIHRNRKVSVVRFASSSEKGLVAIFEPPSRHAIAVGGFPTSVNSRHRKPSLPSFR